jgi:membrane protease YdiL (CAAX protease family)
VRERVALLVTTLVLIGQFYFGDQPEYWKLFPDGDSFGAISWWAAAKVIGYLLIPLAALLLGGGRLRDCGLGWGQTTKHAKIYLLFLVGVLPLVFAASRSEAFLRTYPFYRGAHQLGWELIYAATFVSLEFLFRGYLLFALEPVMGASAIFVTVIPYVMVHFGKPLPECLGAVAAGTALGWMALKTRSIWGGVCVHIAVAMSMDLLALYR